MAAARLTVSFGHNHGTDHKQIVSPQEIGESCTGKIGNNASLGGRFSLRNRSDSRTSPEGERSRGDSVLWRTPTRLVDRNSKAL